MKKFDQNVKLGHKNSLSTKEKESVLDAYNECTVYDVPKNMPKIKSYKYELCDEMERSITQSGIPLARREKAF